MEMAPGTRAGRAGRRLASDESRRPSGEEVSYWQAKLSGARDQVRRRQQLEDFLWALLSRQEFTTNH